MTGAEIAVAVAAVVAAGASAYAASESAAAQSDAAKYNKKLAEQQAASARLAGEVAEQNQREEARRVMARQRALLGASGIVGDEGSALLVQMDTAEQAEREALRARYSGQLGEQGFRAQAGLFGFEARTARRQGTLLAGASAARGLAGALGAIDSRRPPSTTSSSTAQGLNYP